MTDHVGAGGTRTCVRYDSGALRRYKSTLALAPPDPRAHAATERAAAASARNLLQEHTPSGGGSCGGGGSGDGGAIGASAPDASAAASPGATSPGAASPGAARTPRQGGNQRTPRQGRLLFGRGAASVVRVRNTLPL